MTPEQMKELAREFAATLDEVNQVLRGFSDALETTLRDAGVDADTAVSVMTPMLKYVLDAKSPILLMQERLEERLRR